MNHSMRLKHITFIFLIIMLGCTSYSNGEEIFVKFETSRGNFIVKLYDETPLHKDNFVKLVNQGFYDDQLFHRVINQFMIQGGDPDSKNAAPGVLLGAGDPGYQIPAEFYYPRYFHKKGVLAAAREGDLKNPARMSSGSQFFIVTGRHFSEKELNDLDIQSKERTIRVAIQRIVDSSAALQRQLENTDDMMKVQLVMDSLHNAIVEEYNARGISFKIPDDVKKVYLKEGGAPWLDKQYTIFGEVVEGMEVVERIQSVRTDRNDRPQDDIKMKVKIIKR